VTFTLRPLYPQRKSPWYPLGRGLSGSQSRSGHGGEEKNSQSLQGLEPPIIQPVFLFIYGNYYSLFESFERGYFHVSLLPERRNCKNSTGKLSNTYSLES